MYDLKLFITGLNERCLLIKMVLIQFEWGIRGLLRFGRFYLYLIFIDVYRLGRVFVSDSDTHPWCLNIPLGRFMLLSDDEPATTLVRCGPIEGLINAHTAVAVAGRCIEQGYSIILLEIETLPGFVHVHVRRSLFHYLWALHIVKEGSLLGSLSTVGGRSFVREVF